MSVNGRLAIFGAGGHGRVVADAAEASGWAELIFFDDKASSSSVGPWPVVGTFSQLLGNVQDFEGVIVAIGHNRRRLVLLDDLAAHGASLTTIVHSSAVLSRHVQIEPGVFVAAGAVVNIGAEIARGAIVNTGATVDHDCRIAAGVHIAPGVHMSGGVVVGECSWVGVGAAIKELVNIGSDCIIGAGSVVIRSVHDRTTVVGNPARQLHKS